MALPDSELGTLPVETALLEDEEALYRCVAGFILLRSEGWRTARHLLLAEALRESPRPVLVANPDVSAPHPDERYSAEPGYWALRVEAETDVRCESWGKPFGPAFELALSRLGGAGVRRERVAMVGDGLYTDILGGLAAGTGDGAGNRPRVAEGAGLGGQGRTGRNLPGPCDPRGLICATA